MLNTIISKKFLNNENTLCEFVLNEPTIAQHARGGNFVILRLDETGERFPLTIADYNRDSGTITLVVLRVGKSTNKLSRFCKGDQIKDVVGPLGKSIPIEKYDSPILFIGGGVGIAPIYPQVKELKAAGNQIITILGARTRNLLFWEDRFKELTDELIITTDDGSYGKKGLVTDRLSEVVEKQKIAHVTAIGPLIMMKFVALATKAVGIPTTVSLNTMMVDGTGMCGGCRFQTLTGEIKFACVDGPDFDGHNVDFDNLLKRNRRFIDEEQRRLKAFEQECRAIDNAQKT
jgi:ferredoxin--NADP+ reductase